MVFGRTQDTGTLLIYLARVTSVAQNSPMAPSLYTENKIQAFFKVCKTRWPGLWFVICSCITRSPQVHDPAAPWSLAQALEPAHTSHTSGESCLCSFHCLDSKRPAGRVFCLNSHRVPWEKLPMLRAPNSSMSLCTPLLGICSMCSMVSLPVYFLTPSQQVFSVLFTRASSALSRLELSNHGLN